LRDGHCCFSNFPKKFYALWYSLNDAIILLQACGMVINSHSKFVEKFIEFIPKCIKDPGVDIAAF